ncbi:VOC family protein [Plantactinospora siamensis]|uniref:VOC family protein n=1 Tax=Plantactinospora siamensis TaxID=555372 RepID=A0ABV6P016_9ACTN
MTTNDWSVMEGPYPRLLVDDFAPSFRFYAAVLPELAGAVLTRGDAAGPYASWDVAAQTRFALLDRRLMAAAGTASTDPAGPPGADPVLLVLRVADVDAAMDVAVRAGARVVAAAADRPEWGPTMRAGHLRDPAGTLIELQSY